MQNKALVVIDIQNDMTKNYKEIIDNINASVAWALKNDIYVIYMKHFNLSEGTRTFKPNTRGSELAFTYSFRLYFYEIKRKYFNE